MDALSVLPCGTTSNSLHHHQYQHHHSPLRGVPVKGKGRRKLLPNPNSQIFKPSSHFHNQAIKVDAQKPASPTDLESVEQIWPSPNDKIPFWKRDFPSPDKSSEFQINVENDSNLMHIVHVTAEMAPIAKVGGLGDVVTGLARACLSRGHKVEIMLPFYECLQKQQIKELHLLTAYNSYHDGSWVPTNAYHGLVSGISIIFIEPSNHFFKGESVYGGSYNELEAYLFFTRACLEWMQVTGSQPDIIHIHEWQTSALPMLFWDMYYKLSLQKPRIVLTIHNMEHYGECGQEQLSKCGLDGFEYATIDKAVDDRTIGHNPERLCLLKGGIVYSNAVVYSGILNGIDTALWNPGTDVFLPAKFNAQRTQGKKICKIFVQRGLGLAPDSNGVGDMESMTTHNVPLVVCITRLVSQKGLHLITHAIEHVEKLGGQMIVLGKAPDTRVEREFEALTARHNEGLSIRILLTYSEELSHMLYAAADMVLVPSIYEPCGLAQMIGMRYGAVPIVRKTGGLADTVFDIDDQSHADMANGFVFDGIDEGSLAQTLDRAFSHYHEKPNAWTNMVQKIMEIYNSWNRTAGNYIDVYNSVRIRW